MKSPLIVIKSLKGATYSLSNHVQHSKLYVLLYIPGYTLNSLSQGLGKGYQPKPKAEADNPELDLNYPGYHKTSSNNCFYFFLKHLRGPESQILESDWLIPRAPAVRIFPSGPNVRTAPIFPELRLF